MHSSRLVKIVHGNVFISFHIEKYRIVGIVKLCLNFSISLAYQIIIIILIVILDTDGFTCFCLHNIEKWLPW